MQLPARALSGLSEPANSLSAFASEEAPQADPVQALSVDTGPAREPRGVTRPEFVRPIVIAVVLIGLSSLAVFALRLISMPQLTASVQPGHLTITTRPDGSEVLIDGQRGGATPFTVALAPGPHTITIRNGSDERVVPVTMTSGADVSQYFEMRTAAPAAVPVSLSVVTDPPGALVTVDGRRRGVSPVTVADLTTGEHTVTISGEAGTFQRIVSVAAGSTASVVFSLPKLRGPVGGWLSIAAAFDVEVVEHGAVIGTTGMRRIMLASGRHDLVLRNLSLGYSEVRTITVTAGETTALRIDAPKARVSVNARPWAEIMLNGVSVGQTPIANLVVAIGTHEMVFRHPQLGERKQIVVVTATGPNRIAADLTK